MARENAQPVKEKAAFTHAQNSRALKAPRNLLEGSFYGVKNSERIDIGEMRSHRCLSPESYCSLLSFTFEDTPCAYLGFGSETLTYQLSNNSFHSTGEKPRRGNDCTII